MKVNDFESCQPGVRTHEALRRRLNILEMYDSGGMSKHEQDVKVMHAGAVGLTCLRCSQTEVGIYVR